jgi:pimeloyl-ACP methyl ester carboxylesterase
MKPAGLLWRGLFLLLVAVLLAAGFLLALAASWRADEMARLEGEADGVEIGDGTVVQYVVRGTGRPVLVVHGAPGGYDQALAVAAACGLDADSMVIAPSRPGYLGTSLDFHLTPTLQANVLTAFLDALGIEKAAVIGFSAGVPSAIAMALDHPARVSRLVLVSGVFARVPPATEDVPPPLPRAVLTGLTGDVGAWLAGWASANDPARLADASLPLLVGPQEISRLKDFVMGNPEQQEILASFARSVIPVSPRETGTRNDILQIRTLPKLPLANITVPTLVIHGTADPFIPAEQARAAAAAIPGATFLPVEGAGHLVWLGPDAARAAAAIRAFLEAGPGQTPPEDSDRRPVGPPDDR